MTSKRMEEIQDLVDRWNVAEAEKIGIPANVDLCDTLDPDLGPEEFAKAAAQIGVPVMEFAEWFRKKFFEGV